MVALKHFCLLLCIVLVATDPISTPTQSNHSSEELVKLGIINYLHPDALLNVKEIIQKYGYPLEVFEVVTEDGYILEMHRIPHGLNNSNPDPNRPVIFLMHGVLCSSADWVLTGPEKGLGFILADLGYDVWLGNARGNTWSRKHQDYNPNKYLTKFWDFSWHEIGVYDLPAMVDQVLNQTGAENIFYVGHSQGTTAFYVMTSEKPEYNNKIRLMISLAPIAYMGNLPNFFFKLIAKFEGVVGMLAKLIGVNEFMPSSALIQLLGKTLCDESSPINGVCSNILFLICGYNSKQLNETILPIILTHTPAGSSTRQILHYGQEVNSKKFRQYDYGLIKNLLKYKKISPPKYDISKITAPVALFYAANDLLASKEDVKKLADELPNLVIKYLIEDDKFNHLDFLWANEVVPLVYERVIKTLSHY